MVLPRFVFNVQADWIICIFSLGVFKVFLEKSSVKSYSTGLETGLNW